MKSKVSVLLVSLIALISSSCKKESFPDITGQWTGTAYYRNDGSSFVWYSSAMVRYNEQASFDATGRFGFSSDTPEGGGTYSYKRSSGQLILNYETGLIGSPAHSDTLRVEKIDNNQLIIAAYSSTGNLFGKTQYTRY